MKTRLSVRFNPLFIGLMITCLFAGVWSQPVPDSVLGRAATEVNQVVESARPAIVTVEGVLAGGRTIRSSGFVIDPAGWVVCSAEGVSEARSARVYLASGQAFPARVQGIDNITGIALLRLEGGVGLDQPALGQLRKPACRRHRDTHRQPRRAGRERDRRHDWRQGSGRACAPQRDGWYSSYSSTARWAQASRARRCWIHGVRWSA
ncbi:MAG: hypothetical protein KatS3mg021_1398 [Fimbriimonadales bacterium]|nr:MAG: hypothetical protein KatS3mg021_1398 [Fimbriimonadales bacterium]